MKRTLLSVTLVIASLAQAHALSPIREVPELVNELVEGRAADLVRKTCPEYSANMVSAMLEVKKLKNKAVSMGYSEDDIKSFIKSDTEKSFVYGKADALLADLGAVKGQASSYCKAGDALVARGGVASRIISR